MGGWERETVGRVPRGKAMEEGAAELGTGVGAAAPAGGRLP